MKNKSTVQVSELKAKLSEYLRLIKKGKSLVIMERNAPIAFLEKYEDKDLEVREAEGSFQLFVKKLISEPRRKEPVDSLSVLQEDRAKR